MESYLMTFFHLRGRVSLYCQTRVGIKVVVRTGFEPVSHYLIFLSIQVNSKLSFRLLTPFKVAFNSWHVTYKPAFTIPPPDYIIEGESLLRFVSLVHLPGHRRLYPGCGFRLPSIVVPQGLEPRLF